MAVSTQSRRPGNKTGRPSPAVARVTASNTWLGMTIAQCTSLAALIVALLVPIGAIYTWYDKYVMFFESHPIFSFTIIAILVIYILCFNVLPQMWRRFLKARRDAITLTQNQEARGIKHFRLDPYVTATPQEFRREDDAHNGVLQWIRETTRPVLFLSGVSGSGKSSVLEAYVLPILQAEGWRIEPVRSFGDPLPRLEAILATRRPRRTRLLIVLDQFEEFVILEDRMGAEERRQFLTRIRELRQTPPPGLCLLFSFRRDYMSDVIAMKIDDLVPNTTFMEIDSFRRDAARLFLERAPDAPVPALVNRLLAGAEALDDVPARFRPITLNMLGLALQDFDRQVTSRPERLVQGYMEAAIAQPEIKAIATRVVEKMITDANTKEPRTVAELVAQTGLGDKDVVACLVLLARSGLVRRLDAAQNLWEISHDFVARQFALLLDRLRPNIWPTVAMFAAPILFILILSGILVGVPVYVRYQAYAALRGLNVSATEDDSHRVVAKFSPTATDATLKSALSPLIVLGVSSLDLSAAKVENLEPLKGLIALQKLNLGGTKVEDLEPLKSLTSLQSLDLSGTNVQNLEPLKGLIALQTLNLRHTKKIEELEPLKGMSRLMSLDLGETDVENLEPLKGLPALQSLNLSHARVRNLEPLRGLITLQSLELSWTRVGNLEPLRGLTAIESLGLGGTEVEDHERLKGLTTYQSSSPNWRKVENLEPLRDLTALRSLDLSWTNVQNLEPLKGLPALRSLNLSQTKVQNLAPLRGLSALQSLNLRQANVENLEPLQGLTALQQLDLNGTKAENLGPLRGLTTLWWLDLSYKKLDNLEPLKDLTALRWLSLVGTRAESLEPLEELPALQTLLTGLVPDEELRRFKRYRQEKKLQWVEM
jgi:hypothetical protein